jgi:hypothetical protein
MSSDPFPSSSWPPVRNASASALARVASRGSDVDLAALGVSGSNPDSPRRSSSRPDLSGGTGTGQPGDAAGGSELALSGSGGLTKGDESAGEPDPDPDDDDSRYAFSLVVCGYASFVCVMGF